jgi:hypothetical protein
MVEIFLKKETIHMPPLDYAAENFLNLFFIVVKENQLL